MEEDDKFKIFIILGLTNKKDLLELLEYISMDDDLFVLFDQKENLIWNETYSEKTQTSLKYLSSKNFSFYHLFDEDHFIQNYKVQEVTSRIPAGADIIDHKILLPVRDDEISSAEDEDSDSEI